MLYQSLAKTGIAQGHLAKSVHVLSNEGSEQIYGCVPNGGIGISIILKGDCFIRKGEVWQQQPKMFIYGLVRQVQWHKMTAGYQEITIVFRPYYLQLLLKDRLSDLPEAAAIPLYDLFGRNEADKLYDSLSKSDGDADIHAAVETFLSGFLKKKTLDSRIPVAYSLICDQKLRRVEDISARLNISSARLRELFRNHVGLSPKELIKIRRINESFRIKEHNEDSLTGLAYKLDYFDQAHFIHEFKEATGITPKQYFRNPKLTFDFYNFGRWDQNSFV
jgi:AraC-like DNA-binding protein